MATYLHPALIAERVYLAPLIPPAVTTQPVVTAVFVSPSAIILDGLAQRTFTATVIGSNNPSPAVTWATTLGSISAGGVLTLPAATPLVQIAIVTATSVADPSKIGSAVVTISPTAIVRVFLDVPAPRSRTIRL